MISSMAFIAAHIDATGRYASHETIAGFSIPYVGDTDDCSDVDKDAVVGGVYT